MDMKKIYLLALIATTLVSAPSAAQETSDETTDEKELTAYVEAGLVSHYMWRGINMAGVSLQPEAGIAWRGLSLTLEGSTGFEKSDLKEIDINLQYERWGFNIGVTDYWTSGTDPDDRYFYYHKDKGPHQFEANLGYTCKWGSLQAYTIFWGIDNKINGNRAYSTFIELSVPFRLVGLDCDARVGITPMESAGTRTLTVLKDALGNSYNYYQNDYLYGEGFTCNMVSLRATKTLEYKHVKIPIYAEFHANPYLQKAQLLAGVAVRLF